MRRFLPFAVLAAPLLAGCGERASEGVDSLLKEAVFAESIPVETLALEPRDFDERFDASGVIEAEEEVRISAEIAGRILVIHREIGDRVAVGAPLLSLDSSEIDARINKIEAQLARARTQHDWARKDLERQARLFDQAVSAERAYDDAQRLLDTSEDELAAAEADLELARVDLARSTVKSPIAGRVARRHVSAGEYVRPGTELFDVVATQRVKFVFSVAERDVVALEPGQELEVWVDAWGGDPVVGRVRAIAPAGNPQTRTFRVEVELANSQVRPLLPGMSGRTSVLRRRFENVLLLPEEAVLRDDRGGYVYLDVQGQAQRAPVTILSQVGDKAVVAADLAPGADCVILGQSALVEGTSLRVRRRHESIPETRFD